MSKPPTRLQAQAPASLELDQITLSAAPSASADSLPADDTASNAIPLLSPLVLSPAPSPETAEILVHVHDQVTEQQEDGSTSGKIGGAELPQVSSGWQHPAISTLNDPPLCSFFQSQCMVVNPAQ